MRAHLIAGGFPPGSPAGHDMDFVRLRLLQLLDEQGMQASVSNDFVDVGRWLTNSQLLVTYVAGPFPDDQRSALIEDWLTSGGHWLALHGTSGGKAARLEGGGRQMVKLAHHRTLGSFFLNHPPIRQFTVKVEDPSHPLMEGIPPSFDVADELYMIEMQSVDAKVLLTTQLPENPVPGFGFTYEGDTSLMADGKRRVLGYVRQVGDGAVVYWALGHCHSPATNSQPFVDSSVSSDGTTPLSFHGVWESATFNQLLVNSITWATR